MRGEKYSIFSRILGKIQYLNGVNWNVLLTPRIKIKWDFN